MPNWILHSSFWIIEFMKLDRENRSVLGEASHLIFSPKLFNKLKNKKALV